MRRLTVVSMALAAGLWAYSWGGSWLWVVLLVVIGGFCGRWIEAEQEKINGY